jgi:hypothetical protein
MNRDSGFGVRRNQLVPQVRILSRLTVPVPPVILPFWRGFKEQPHGPRDPEADRKIVEEINTWVDGGPGIQSHDEHDVDKLDHVTISRSVMPRKGRWRRFSEEQEERMREAQKKSS